MAEALMNPDGSLTLAGAKAALKAEGRRLVTQEEAARIVPVYKTRVRYASEAEQLRAQIANLEERLAELAKLKTWTEERWTALKAAEVPGFGFSVPE